MPTYSNMKLLFPSLLLLAAATLAPLHAADSFADLSSEDYAARLAARDALFAEVSAATAPGAEGAARIALEKQILAHIGAETPPPTRFWSLRMLQYIGGDDAVEPLAAVLADENAEIHDAAREALACNPSPAATDALTTSLKKSTDPAQTAGFIEALAWRRDAGAVPLIAPFVAGEDAQLKKTATQALARLGGEEASKALRDAFAREAANPFIQTALLQVDPGKDTLEKLLTEGANPAIRAGAFSQLDKTDSAAAAVRLKSILDDPAFPGRLAIVRRAMDSEAQRKELIERLPSLDSSAQLVVLNAITELHLPAETAALAFVDSEDESLNLAAITALGLVGGDASFPVLMAQINSPSRSVKESAERALANLDAAVDERLLKEAKTCDEAARLTAIRAMSVRNSPGATAYLTSLAGTEKSPAVHDAALSGLESIGDLQSCVVLANLVVQTEDPAVRRSAQRSLKRLATRMQLRDAIWEKAFAPALEIAKTDEDRAALVLILDGISSDGALAYLKKPVLENDPVLRPPALRALGNWQYVDAGDLWLAVATAPEADPKDVKLAFQTIARFVSSKSIKGGMGPKAKLAGKAFEAAPTPEYREMVLTACKAIPAKQRSGLRKYLEPLANEPEFGAKISALLKENDEE